jgi:hypothetical protein
MRIPLQGRLARLLQIPYRARRVLPSLKMHRQLRGDFLGPLAIAYLLPPPDRQMQAHPPPCAKTLI